LLHPAGCYQLIKKKRQKERKVRSYVHTPQRCTGRKWGSQVGDLVCLPPEATGLYSDSPNNTIIPG